MSVPSEPPRTRSRSPVVVILIAVGCLGLLLVGGIVAAIVIPNFFTARDRARLVQTMSEMRSVGEALEAYYDANGRYPAAESMSELVAAVASGAETLPTSNAWGHELRYQCWPAGTCEYYVLVSPGKDGTFEREDLTAYEAQPTPRGDYDRDIVLSNGHFVQYPGAD